ncbi:MAG: TIGR04255 family protein [Methylohalobius sp. ZOD2]
MSNAPVYYALVQVKFNPVAAMAKYVDEIQDHLRREGYTLFEPQQVTHLQFRSAPAGQAPNEPQVGHTTSWLITKGDRTAGFILNASSLTFHTTHYETHNEFIPELLLGLKAVHDVVNLEHLDRLGLRYLDAVLPKSGEIEVPVPWPFPGCREDFPCPAASPIPDRRLRAKVGGF